MTGIIAAFVCALTVSGKDLLSKRLSCSVSGNTSAFASFAFALPFYAALMLVLWLCGMEDFAFSWRFAALVFLRALTDTFAETLKMHAFAHGDISFISCLFAFTPLILLVLSPLITGDQIPREGVLAVLLIFVGTLVVTYRSPQEQAEQEASPDAKNGTKAICLTLGACVFFALNNCLDRLAVQVASPALSAFAMTALAAVFLLPIVVRTGGAAVEMKQNWQPFAIRGSIEVLFMVARLVALQFMQVSYVVGIQNSSIVLSIVGGKLLYKEQHFLRRLTAGLIILSGVLIIIFTLAK